MVIGYESYRPVDDRPDWTLLPRSPPQGVILGAVRNRTTDGYISVIDSLLQAYLNSLWNQACSRTTPIHQQPCPSRASSLLHERTRVNNR